ATVTCPGFLSGAVMGRPEGSARPPLVSAMALSLLALSLLSAGVSSLPQPLPRVFLSFEDLQASQSFEHYSISDKAMDYRILQMDEDQDRMYVGCKDHVLSMDINNITHGTLKVFWPASPSKIEECQMAGKDPTLSVEPRTDRELQQLPFLRNTAKFLTAPWIRHGCGNFIRVVQPYNRTHLFMCGSGAYSPVCVYINRGRRPETKELFSGMYIDFMGTDAAIFRSLTRRNAVRTDQHNSKWLSEPIFIDAHLIPDGTDPNDAKLYFFFRERLTDNSGNTKNIHTMVARVCPNDIGGQRSLVNKWTTFLKARMVCSVLEEDGTETHFDELENMFLLETDQPKGLLVFGVFTSTSSVFKGSAVCVYNMADILTIFNGPFAHREGPNFQWVAYQGRIPYPRPGTCPGGAFTPDIKTTKEFPDDVVTFVRNHPVMFNPIYPVGRRPLVVRTNADYKYTSVAVDQVIAADGNYQVLFLGTDKGTVQKVIVLPSNHSLHEDLILEELEVFKNQAPVTNLRISPKKQQLYVSSEFGVSQVSLHRCHAYGSACADCCLARDPYCAWDGFSCSRFYPTGKRYSKGSQRSRRQDIMHGNPLTQCRGFNLKAYRNAVEMTQYGVRNNTTFLECLPKSPQASIRWLIQRDNDRRKEVSLTFRRGQSWNTLSGPLFKKRDHHPSLPLQRHCPQPPCNVAEVCQPRQPHNIQRLEVLRADLIHPRRLATEELANYLSDFGSGDGRVHLRVPSLRFLTGRQVGGIEEILEVFLPPSDNVPSRGQQLPTRTVNSVGRVLLPPSEAPDGLPESLRGRPIVLLHGLTELLPDPSFCLQDRPKGCGLLGLPVPVAHHCVQESHRPTWPDRDSFFSLTASLTLPTPGSGLPPRQAPETLRPQLRTAASTMEAENMVHSDSMSPASLGICEKLFRRWELKTSLTEGSARCSQQTLTIRFGSARPPATTATQTTLHRPLMDLPAGGEPTGRRTHRRYFGLSPAGSRQGKDPATRRSPAAPTPGLAPGWGPVKLSDRVVSTEHGLLIRSVQPSDQGLYYCLTTENNFKRTVAKIRLRMLSEAMVSVLTDKQQSPWAWASSLHPKVLLAAFSPAESLAVQQYCKERKELQNLQQRQQQQRPQPPGPLRGDLAKLKPLLDRRKSRNRRNHLPEV
ncbi:hypothetical protein L3Q82_009355, partial [Scortum barcoo]